MSYPKSDEHNDYIETMCEGPNRLVRVGVKLYQPSSPTASPAHYFHIQLFRKDIGRKSFVSLSREEFSTMLEKMKNIDNYLERAYGKKVEKKVSPVPVKRVIKRALVVETKKPRVIVKEEPKDDAEVMFVPKNSPETESQPDDLVSTSQFEEIPESQPLDWY